MARYGVAAWIRLAAGALALTALQACAPSPARAAVAADPAPERALLQNAAHVILKPEPSSEIVAITAIVRMPEDDTLLENATGELVARALFFGSLNSTFETVANSVAQVGGNLETMRTPDYVVISCITVRQQLDDAIYMLCEALKNAQFAPDALERARRAYVDACRLRESSPFDAAYEACAATQRTVAGPDPAYFGRVTQEKARDYFLKRYVPNRTVIAIVGRFDAAQARTDLETDLADFTRLPPPYPPFPPKSEAVVPDPTPVDVPIGGTTACALVGIRAPGVRSPDYPAYVVLQALLGGGHASRLFRRIRDALGFGYEVGAAFQADRGDPMVAYLQWDARRAVTGSSSRQNALATLQQQLDSVKTDPPTEAEVARARNVAIGRDALRHERARDRSFLLAWYEAMQAAGGYGFDARLPDLLAHVTRDDVLRVAHTYLPERSAVLALPSKP
jgi:zinc protease